MQKIFTHLWYDKEAKEAAQFYVDTFPNSSIKNISSISNTPSGNVDILTIEIMGYEFQLISAGPLFKFTPAISFHVSCKEVEMVDLIWNKLLDGGKVMMEIGTYPFSKRYGWIQDKYGVSWQIIYTGDMEHKQNITPVLMFVDNVCGKAEEAIDFYTSIFNNSHVNGKFRYASDESPDDEGTIKYGSFVLEGHEFGAMDSARTHGFGFNEAISLVVNCKDQEEIDYYWNKLSAVPEAEQCGWLKDKFGVSWQIVPEDLGGMMENGNEEQKARVTKSFLQMKKFNLAELQKAYTG